MSDMTAREHALRVAVLGALLDVVKSEYGKARDAAEPEFAAMRAEGQKQQAVMLPDGTEIGLVSIKAGTPALAVTEGGLEAWVREHLPDGMEDYVVPAALADIEVIDMLKACFPHAVRQRIRTATRAALLAEMTESGGKLADKVSGEVEQVGEVEQHKPTGAFSYRSAKGARDRIVAEWRAGRLTEIAFGPLALPGAAPVPDASPDPVWAVMDAADNGMPFGVFGDELGLLDPVKAAHYAIVMSNGAGFTTPPIEAYRMLRDGGIHAERARAWMEENGLDPADPREGKDTPWPLPAARDTEAGLLWSRAPVYVAAASSRLGTRATGGSIARGRVPQAPGLPGASWRSTPTGAEARPSTRFTTLTWT